MFKRWYSTVVVTSGYLSFHISVPIVLWPLTLRKDFLSAQLPLSGLLVFFDHVCFNGFSSCRVMGVEGAPIEKIYLIKWPVVKSSKMDDRCRRKKWGLIECVSDGHLFHSPTIPVASDYQEKILIWPIHLCNSLYILLLFSVDQSFGSIFGYSSVSIL